MATHKRAPADERRLTIHVEPEPLAVLALRSASRGWNLLLGQVATLIEEAAEAMDQRLSPQAWEYLELCAEFRPAALLTAHRFPGMALGGVAREAMERGGLHRRVWSESPGHYCGALIKVLEHAADLESLSIILALRHRQECERCARDKGVWWTVLARQRCQLLGKPERDGPLEKPRAIKGEK